MSSWDVVREDLQNKRSPSKKTLQSLISEEFCPDDLRKFVWPILLGVDGKPDTITARKINVVPDSDIAMRCTALLAKETNAVDDVDDADDIDDDLSDDNGDEEIDGQGDGNGSRDERDTDNSGNENGRKCTSDDLARVLMAYCQARGKSKGFAMESDWPEIALLFFSLGLSVGDTYNCFYAFESKLGANNLQDDGAVYEVFRLLLQYHEPKLYQHLHTLHIKPFDFLSTWFRGLFSLRCTRDVSLALWDCYLSLADPFLVVFLSFVFVVNAKDFVFELGTDRDAIVSFLREMPNGIAISDVNDLVNLGKHYSSVTPSSLRDKYAHALFGASSSTNKDATDVADLLCFDIEPSSLLPKLVPDAEISLVDLRTESQFAQCRLRNTAANISADEILNDPEKFSALLDGVLETSKSSNKPICFMVSDDDQSLLGMVVSSCLKKHVEHVTFVRGGFFAAHKCVKEMDAVQLYVEGKRPQTTPKVVANPIMEQSTQSQAQAKSKWSNWTSTYKAKTSMFGEMLKKKGSEYKEKISTQSKAFSSNLQATLQTVETKLQNVEFSSSKPYRENEIKSNFSIDDDDEDDERGASNDSEEHGIERDLASAIVKKVKGELIISIDKVEQESNVLHVFPVNELHGSLMYPSHLVLTQTHAMKLREIQGGRHLAAVMWRRKLVSIVRITAKKKAPTLLTFLFVGEHVDAREVTAALDEALKKRQEEKEKEKQEDKQTEHDAEENSQKEQDDTVDGGKESKQYHNKPKVTVPGTFKERYLVPQAVEAKKVLRQLIEAARTKEEEHFTLTKKAMPQEKEEKEDDDDDEDEENEPQPYGTISRQARKEKNERSIRWFVTEEKKKGAGMGEDGFEQWFHGVISRRESEARLKNQKSGTFLVRVAESRFGYTLSMVNKGRVKHFMINVTDKGEYKMVGNSRLFVCLNDIVSYHVAHSITKVGDKLSLPCPHNTENLKQLQ
eukprot:m.202235 g.202235  ORF g.202235 m.202235 type:complete len:961 (+) comp13721_c0_seq3:62-2944(+)